MSDPVTRLNKALEGRYHIERELGEGGMATVYLARDERHNRNVALKVLKPELAAVVGAARFLAEIETTANLQHPHILPLFDSGEADGFLFYVMPYVEGESLRERLDREHQLPVDDAVRIATNVAEALDYAHRHGVIHRDIKPANILLQDGKPVVSDFGIALALGVAGAGRLTETGLSLGTPHYMSPEQATGDLSVGLATDIYALGCVLYEMLVGEPPYTGSTPQAVLGKIIAGELTSTTKQRSSVPANVDAAIRTALEKLPADRFTGAQEFVGALADRGFQHAASVPARTKAGESPWNRLTVATSSLAAVFAIVTVWLLLVAPLRNDPLPVHRFEVGMPAGSWVHTNIAEPISFTPDGESIIVAADGVSDLDSPRLLRRPLGSIEMIPVRGIEWGGTFFLSPDGEWLGSHNGIEERLIRVPFTGGPSTTITPTPGSSNQFRGANWGDTGLIVYSAARYQGLMTVPALGGQPDTLTVPEDGETHQYPRFLPGGGTVVFERVREGQPPQIAALSVESGEFDDLTQGTQPDYVPGGFLVFRRDDALWAARFDEGRRALETDPVPVVEGLRGPNRFFALSANGSLVYAEEGEGMGGARLTIVDLQGNEEAVARGPLAINTVSWSLDGESVVYSRDGQIYTYNVVLNTTASQLTFRGTNQNPVFSPDGSRVAFNSNRDGTDGHDVFVKNLDDDSPPRSIITLEENQIVSQWPSDSLIVFEQGARGNRELWTIDLSDPGNPRAEEYLSSEASLENMVISPDGTLAAYTSNETLRYETYIRSFPEPGPATMVSDGEGNTAHVPSWSPDGNTLYFLTGSGQPLMAARLQRGPVPVVLSRDTLVASVSYRPFQGSGLHPDGDRFILPRNVGETDAMTDHLILVENFLEELKRLVPN